MVARARLLGLMSKYGWTLWASIQDATSGLDFDFWAWGMEKYDRAVEEFDGSDFERPAAATAAPRPTTDTAHPEGPHGRHPTQLSDDERKLAELGYKQDLNRSWSGFSNFAISFSIISILAGCFTNFGAGWNNGGPISISLVAGRSSASSS